MAKDALPHGIVIIYGLADPITTELRYVGKTWYSLAKRRKQHLGHSKNEKIRDWVEHLRSQNVLPQIFEIERADRHSWIEVERFWIAYFQFVGCNLLNLHEGGGGSISHSAATLGKIAEKRSAWAANPVNIEAQSARSKAKWLDEGFRSRTISAIRAANTPEVCRKRSAQKKHQWATSPEYRMNVAAAQAKVDRSTIAKAFWQRPEYQKRRREADEKRRARGPWVSEEQKRKQSAALKGRKQSPEAAAKSAASRIGLKLSDEAKAKISAKARARHAAKLASQS